jgi:nucleoid-associated protein YgaU
MTTPVMADMQYAAAVADSMSTVFSARVVLPRPTDGCRQRVGWNTLVCHAPAPCGRKGLSASVSAAPYRLAGWVRTTARAAIPSNTPPTSESYRMYRKPLLAVATALVLSVSLASNPAFAQEADGEAPAADAPAADAPAVPEAEAEAPAADDKSAEQAASDYNRELLTIEEEVHSHKEKVFRAKATLQLLKEIVVQGNSAGSRATIMHENKLGRGYTLESISYYLDGQGKFSKADPTGGLDDMREFKVFEGAVPPGSHNITVNLRLRGNGFGVFSYVKNYTFAVQSSTAFTAEEGKSCKVRVVMDERKGIGRSFIERPHVEFETRCIRLSDSAAQQ